MLLKAKVTIGLMLMNASVNIVLLILDGLTIEKSRNIQTNEDSLLNLQKDYQGLGVQLSFTEKKTTSEALKDLGAISICNSVAVVTISIVMTICLANSETKNVYFALSFGITGGISLILLVPKAIYTHRIGTEIDWSQIKQLNEANMLQKLHSEYKNDIISQYRNTSSDRWNLFFLTHKCCAVHSVQSTTNDFDLTYWCTTSGSCQQTNSQIPKACCKNVTADNYTLADSQCHEFVSPETYHEKGCASIWIENPYISPLKGARGSMYKYQISAAAFEFVSEGISLLTIILTYFWQL